MGHVDSVEKLSTLFVDKLICWLSIVDTVEKLSSLSVENFERSVFLWEMWKSYPQNMWITKQFLISCGQCGKVIPNNCGKVRSNRGGCLKTSYPQ